MCFDICNITLQTVIKDNTFHMSYYSVNIVIKGSKEATHQTVDTFQDRVPGSSKGTILTCPCQPSRTQCLIAGDHRHMPSPGPLTTQPHMAWGGFLKKSLELFSR